MRRLLVLAVLALGAAGVDPAAAQVLPIALEARGGLAFPLDDFAAENGVGFGANASFTFFPGLAIYGGLDRYAFAAAEDAQSDQEWVDQGFAVGGELSLPLGMLIGVSPWVRGGALIRTLELSDDGAFERSSSRSAGFELGAGVTIPLGMVLSFTPGVTYRTYEADYDDEEREGRVKYVDVSLGLRARL